MRGSPAAHVLARVDHVTFAWRIVAVVAVACRPLVVAGSSHHCVRKIVQPRIAAAHAASVRAAAARRSGGRTATAEPDASPAGGGGGEAVVSTLAGSGEFAARDGVGEAAAICRPRGLHLDEAIS